MIISIQDIVYYLFHKVMVHIHLEHIVMMIQKLQYFQVMVMVQDFKLHILLELMMLLQHNMEHGTIMVHVVQMLQLKGVGL